MHAKLEVIKKHPVYATTQRQWPFGTSGINKTKIVA
jgi:hypothetical protein